MTVSFSSSYFMPVFAAALLLLLLSELGRPSPHGAVAAAAAATAGAAFQPAFAARRATTSSPSLQGGSAAAAFFRRRCYYYTAAQQGSPPGLAAPFPTPFPTPSCPLRLEAAKKSGGGDTGGGGGGGSASSLSSKRKRKRKKDTVRDDQPPPVPDSKSASASTVPDPPFLVDNIKLEREALEGLERDHDVDEGDEDGDDEDSVDRDDVLLEMKRVAQFEFRPPAEDDDGTCRGWFLRCLQGKAGVAAAADILTPMRALFFFLAFFFSPRAAVSATSKDIDGRASSSSSSSSSAPKVSPVPAAAVDGAAMSTTTTMIPLPDIREARMRKRVEEELAKMEAEKDENRIKIKRSDKEAFRRVRFLHCVCVVACVVALHATGRREGCNNRTLILVFILLFQLLEQQPFADADDSLFEEEAYDSVSALLGERAKPFLGIPVGPLQVGHLVGALAIVLMAFVEYPGFPLTNLPTPLRDALQGGTYRRSTAAPSDPRASWLLSVVCPHAPASSSFCRRAAWQASASCT
jgi:hypothetical protein